MSRLRHRTCRPVWRGDTRATWPPEINTLIADDDPAVDHVLAEFWAAAFAGVDPRTPEAVERALNVGRAAYRAAITDHTGSAA